VQINLYCAGLCRDEGQLSQLGGCGLVLTSTDDYGRPQYREYHYGLGSSDQALCDVQAARLVLASVAPAFRAAKVTLYVDNPKLAEYLIDGVPEIDVQTYKEARRWISYFNDVNVVVQAGDHPQLDRAKELARMGLETQREFDSLTVAGDHNGSANKRPA